MFEVREITDPVEKLIRDIFKLKNEDDYFEYLFLKKELEVKQSEILKIQEKIKKLLNEA